MAAVRPPDVYVANPDEELGSPTSTPVIRRFAEGASIALVLESARENGDIVSSRKGIADFLIRIDGRAAHAGVEPEKGRSATLEAAHKILALHALNGRWPGVTVNVGVVRGGIAAERRRRAHRAGNRRPRRDERRSMVEVEAAINEIAASDTVADVTATVDAASFLAADGEDASHGRAR